jgi:hypothetical protein
MKRSELYELVWQKPMIKLAEQLGISDVGLAKACRRLGIPAPPRGHWAKLQAGKPSVQIPLPASVHDPVVTLHTTPPAKRIAEQTAKKQESEDVKKRIHQLQKVETVESQKKPRRHALVKATADYCATIPSLVRRYERMDQMKRFYFDGPKPPPQVNGRWILSVPNGLELAISDELLEWSLDFYDQILRLLTQSGSRIYRESGEERKPAAIVCERNGERLTFNFREGYRKSFLSTEELAVKKAKSSRANDWEYVPSGQCLFTAQGSEFCLTKKWQGTPSQLSSKRDEIVATCMQLLDAQPERRKQRIDAAEISQKKAEEESKKRRINEGRHRQLEQAFKAAQAFEQVSQLNRFLNKVETECDEYLEPYQDRARVWIKLVREELRAAQPDMEILSRCLSVPKWETWPPEWWPTEG